MLALVVVQYPLNGWFYIYIVYIGVLLWFVLSLYYCLTVLDIPFLMKIEYIKKKRQNLLIAQKKKPRNLRRYPRFLWNHGWETLPYRRHGSGGAAHNFTGIHKCQPLNMMEKVRLVWTEPRTPMLQIKIANYIIIVPPSHSMDAYTKDKNPSRSLSDLWN